MNCSESSGRYARDEFGRALVERDYRIRTDPGMSAGVYPQGGTEQPHGITASLLSTAAVRSGDIFDSVTARSRVSLGV
ncbi:hypothetical protein [Actinoplanes solisilvae]|uniref:hypothetical protein n=1 Tax=Actinoplanes solisilvae TaxID=2486853 RepID=UPI000FD8FFC9|nr:hypothetical protein [Actinoplanes solisilvae]